MGNNISCCCKGEFLANSELNNENKGQNKRNEKLQNSDKVNTDIQDISKQRANPSEHLPDFKDDLNNVEISH